jgi:hypothetical protein
MFKATANRPRTVSLGQPLKKEARNVAPFSAVPKRACRTLKIERIVAAIIVSRMVLNPVPALTKRSQFTRWSVTRWSGLAKVRNPAARSKRPTGYPRSL